MGNAAYRYDFYTKLNQRIIDALIAGFAFYLAYQLRFEWQVPSEHDYQMWVLVGAITVGQVSLSSLLGAYRLVWRYVTLADVVLIARSYAAFSAILFIVFFAVPNRWALFRIPRSILVLQFLLSLTAALSARVLRRLLYERRHRLSSDPHKAKRIVLIGAARAGVMVTRELSARNGVKAVGFLDDDPKKLGTVINGVPVLGPISSLPSVVRDYGVEEAVVCIARVPRAILKQVWGVCEPLLVRVKIVPTLEEILQGKTNIAAFRDVELSDLLGRDTFKLSLDETALAAYRGKRILITGAGGSIGSELACQLFRLDPEQLVLLDKDENGLHEACLRLPAASTGPIVHPIVADLRFPRRLEALFRRLRPEVVLHAAAHKHVHLMEMNPCEAILNNVVGTRNLVEYSLEFGVSRFVLVSTDKAVKPASIMGASKRVCEMIVQTQPDHGRPHFCCVRFGNVVGSRGSVVPIFEKQIARGGPVTVTHPDVQRFLMTIPEAVCLLIQAGSLGSSGDIFILDMGEPVLISDMARDLIELSGLRPERDIRIEITKLRPGEKLREVLFDDATEKLLPTRYEKIKVINGQPIELRQFERHLTALENAAHRGSAQDVYRVLEGLNIGFHRKQLDVSQSESEKFLSIAASAAGNT